MLAEVFCQESALTPIGHIGMKLETRVFELGNNNTSLPKLAQAMGISVSQIYRVKQGERPVNEKFIIGAIKAFPGYKLDDLFYVEGHNDRQEE